MGRGGGARQGHEVHESGASTFVRFPWCMQSTEEEGRRLSGGAPTTKDSGQGKSSATKDGGHSKNAAPKDGDKGKSGGGSSGVAKPAAAASAATTTASTASTATPTTTGTQPPQPPRDASVTVCLYPPPPRYHASHLLLAARIRILSVWSMPLSSTRQDLKG